MFSKIEIDSLCREGRPLHEKNDCTVRAFSYVACIPYEKAHSILADKGRKDRKGFPSCRIVEALKEMGLQVEERQYDGFNARWRNRWDSLNRPESNKLTYGRWKKEVADPKGWYMVRVANHIFAYIEGVEYDTGKNKERKALHNVYRLVF